VQAASAVDALPSQSSTDRLPLENVSSVDALQSDISRQILSSRLTSGKVSSLPSMPYPGHTVKVSTIGETTSVSISSGRGPGSIESARMPDARGSSSAHWPATGGSVASNAHARPLSNMSASGAGVGASRPTSNVSTGSFVRPADAYANCKLPSPVFGGGARGGGAPAAPVALRPWADSDRQVLPDTAPGAFPSPDAMNELLQPFGMHSSEVAGAGAAAGGQREIGAASPPSTPGWHAPYGHASAATSRPDDVELAQRGAWRSELRSSRSGSARRSGEAPAVAALSQGATAERAKRTRSASSRRSAADVRND
jgi:hypothetical protein